MNLLDENFPQDQRSFLRNWHIPHRQLGLDFSWFGAKDEDILPILHRLHRVTFFTQDRDFFQQRLCHSGYCLVWLDVKADDAAIYVRRFLGQKRFSTTAKRMHIVARAHHGGIDFWRGSHAKLHSVAWE